MAGRRGAQTRSSTTTPWSATFSCLPTFLPIEASGPSAMRENRLNSWPWTRASSAPEHLRPVRGTQSRTLGLQHWGQLESKSYRKPQLFKHLEKSLPGPVSPKSTFLSVSLKNTHRHSKSCLIHYLNISCVKQHFSGTLITEQLLMSLCSSFIENKT